MGRTPRKREAVICRSRSSIASATVSVGGRPPMMASGPPAALALLSSSMVSSIELRPVAAATLTNFSTFHRADSAR